MESQDNDNIMESHDDDDDNDHDMNHDMNHAIVEEQQQHQQQHHHIATDDNEAAAEQEAEPGEDDDNDEDYEEDDDPYRDYDTLDEEDINRATFDQEGEEDGEDDDVDEEDANENSDIHDHTARDDQPDDAHPRHGDDSNCHTHSNTAPTNTTTTTATATPTKPTFDIENNTSKSPTNANHNDNDTTTTNNNNNNSNNNNNNTTRKNSRRKRPASAPPLKQQHQHACRRARIASTNSTGNNKKGAWNRHFVSYPVAAVPRGQVAVEPKNNINNNDNNINDNNINDNNDNHVKDSLAHLSITKASPSFAEPWRKFPPQSVVGVGIILAWGDSGIAAKRMEDETVAATVGNDSTNVETVAAAAAATAVTTTTAAAAAAATTANDDVASVENPLEDNGHSTIIVHRDAMDFAEGAVEAVAVEAEAEAVEGNNAKHQDEHNIIRNSNDHDHHHHHQHDHHQQHGQQQHQHGRQKSNGKCNNNAKSIRILTNAHPLQYATSIRARSSSSPLSLTCHVEWMSLSMDLALLRLDIDGNDGVDGGIEDRNEERAKKRGNHAKPCQGGTATKTTNTAPLSLASAGWKPLPLASIRGTILSNRGDVVSCLGFPTVPLSAISASAPVKLFGGGNLATRSHYNNHSHHHNRNGHHVELDVRRGSVAGFHVDEDRHHMLRMRLDYFASQGGGGGGAMGGKNGQGNDNGGGSGGIVVHGDGSIVGILTSSSSSSSPQHHRGNDTIPGVVIHQFLRQCQEWEGATLETLEDSNNTRSASLSAGITGGCNTTDGECYASTSHAEDTCGSHSEKECAKDGPRPRQTPMGNRCSRSSSSSNIQATNTQSTVSVRYLPGIATLGIHGFQTLENRALRQSLGLEQSDVVDVGAGGVRIIGINHTIHATADSVNDISQCKKEGGKCHSSMLRVDDVLLAIDGEPIGLDGTVRLAPGRENERVDFRWLISQRRVGTSVTLDVMRHWKRLELCATLYAPRNLVPRWDEGDGMPSYVMCGGICFMPLSQSWMSESIEKRGVECGSAASAVLEFQGLNRFLQEQRRVHQQVIVLSNVFPDDVNVGYHGMRNMILTSVNGHRPNNLQHLVELLVKREVGPLLEFRCSYIQLERAKVVISMHSKEVFESERRILSQYVIDAWCSYNALSESLRKEAEGKANRHGVSSNDCWKTMRALRNSVHETTLVARRLKSNPTNNNIVAHTRRIMEWSEEHKMQSAPLFAGKYTDDGGWTQVKTKHLSQLCTCGKSTRFYCICSVGVMRCKDCFLKHSREDHAHDESGACVQGSEVISEGIELVTTKKRKKNAPTQAMQSRCVICKAKTCYCCSACGFEKETALCHVSTGRSCLALHSSEHDAEEKGERAYKSDADMMCDV